MTEEQREQLLPSTSGNDEKLKSTPIFLGFRDTMNMQYFRNAMQNSMSPYTVTQDTVLKDLLGTSHDQTVKLDYVYFPLKLVKTQKRENKISMQRIEDGKVSFSLDFQTTECKENVSAISVSVKRTHESTNPQKYVGCVPIPSKNVELSHIQDSKILVKLDLDSVHTYKNKKVYELDRNKEEENLFHLIIDIQFLSGDKISQNTRPFKLIGRKSAVGSKRTYSDANSPNCGLESDGVQHTISIKSDNDSPDSYGGSPAFVSPHPYSPDDNIGLIEARMIVAEHIKTKYLDLNGQTINLGKAITTPNGDIAYHFLLENDDDVFEEGEIVGFVPDEHSEKKQIITKLTFKSASHAILKGVITRSQYLEAQKPSPGVRSETIAMMGIVPVQVRGSVCANEALYASPHHPGFAVSGQHLDTFSMTEASFIGYAFSGRKADDEQSAGMVQAAVSVLQSAGQKLLSEKLHNLDHDFEERIINISRFGKRTRKCMCIAGILVSIILILVGIFIWQLLLPGSAYRYFICKIGRKQPEGSAYFYMVPLKTPDMYSRVNGIEFDFHVLMEKAGHVDYPLLNGTGYRYYLNIDRCAYGYVTTGDIPRGQKPVRGPTVFIVDKKCYRSYYFSESKNRWIIYNSASWEHYQNICCKPRSKWKNNSTKCNGDKAIRHR